MFDFVPDYEIAIFFENLLNIDSRLKKKYSLFTIHFIASFMNILYVRAMKSCLPERRIAF